MRGTVQTSTLVTSVAFFSGAITYSVLARNPPVDPGPGMIFESCQAIANCSADTCPGAADDVPCAVCEFTYTQQDCLFFYLNSSCSPLPPAGVQCGNRWTGFCLGGVCDYNPINDLDGICTRSLCISS